MSQIDYLEKFRCGIIGLGRIGCGFDDDPHKKIISTHAGAYMKNEKSDLIALCDIDKKKLLKYGKKYHVPGLYTEIHEFFENEKLDCVSICTLANSHLEIVREATEHDIQGIFLEKPISDDLESAKTIVNLCKKKNIKLQIDHQRRFDAFYNDIKKLVKSKKFDPVQYFSINYVAGVANTGSHLFDLCRFFFGDISYVMGKFSKNKSKNKEDPNIDGFIKFKNGIECHIQSFDSNQFRIVEFDIIGKKARIRLDLTNSTVEYFEVSEKMNGTSYYGLTKKPFNSKSIKEPILSGLENLIYSIEKNVNTLCTGEEGYSSLETIIALIESAKHSGKKITLPLKKNTNRISSK